jgi:transposase
MASLQRVRAKGRAYWRIVESRRIDGKPRAIPILYLGTADQLLERLLSAPEGRLRVGSCQHGDVAALKAVADRLGVVEIIDRHVDESRRGLSVGTTLLLGALNRAVRPCSKRSWARWAKGTSLHRLFGVRLESLTSQYFWDQMDTLSESTLEAIENELTRKVIKDFDIKLDTLFYDSTNFFTYIASANARSSLAQRGRSKQRRYDLRQFSLALLVSRDMQIPLCSHLYEGNTADVTVFPDSLTRIRQRLEGLVGQIEELTLVYDKGNNSKKNQALVDQSPLHYVASLVPSQYPELLGIPARRYASLGEGPMQGLPVYRRQQEIWGRKRTLVLLISPQLRAGQIRGLEQHLTKRIRALQAWKQDLAKPHSGPRTLENAHKKIDSLLQGQHLREILRIEYDPARKGSDRLSWRIDQKARSHLESEVFGKRILMTSRHDWSSEEIILAYRGQSQAEEAFRQLKDPAHLAVRPQHHWTDQKVRVHTFICLVALLLSRLLQRQARQLGYKADLSSLLDLLGTVRLAMILHPSGKKGGRPRCRWTLEDADRNTLRLFQGLVPNHPPFVYTP